MQERERKEEKKHKTRKGGGGGGGERDRCHWDGVTHKRFLWRKYQGDTEVVLHSFVNKDTNQTEIIFL